MSENFYPQPPVLGGKHYALLAAAIAIAVAAGIAIGYWLDEPNEKVAELESTMAPEVALAPEQPLLATLPDEPFRSNFVEGQLLSYRLDTEIQGGGTELGEYSDVFMNFGTDVTLFTQRVAPDGTADMRLVFDHASVAGTFFDNPFEITFTQPTPASTSQAASDPQTAFLTTPIEMRVAADGTVLDISSPASLRDMLGSIAVVPQLKFPETELVEGMEWETKLNLPVPGIGDAVNTTVHNKLIGRERMGDYDCGVVMQRIGAKATDATASVGDGDEKPTFFSVPLFDLQGENTIYFDLKTGRLVHAVLDLDFALRIKEQLGDMGKVLQQIIPSLSGEHNANGLGDVINPEGTPDLSNLTLSINGAMTLINEGTPLPLAQ